MAAARPVDLHRNELLTLCALERVVQHRDDSTYRSSVLDATRQDEPVAADRPEATVTVRAAGLGDLDELVELRLENGRCTRPWTRRCTGSPTALPYETTTSRSWPRTTTGVPCSWPSSSSGSSGWPEVSIDPSPPAHQILLPVPTGHLHLVVAAHERGQPPRAAAPGGRHPRRAPHRARVLRPVAATATTRRSASPTWTTCPDEDRLRDTRP